MDGVHTVPEKYRILWVCRYYFEPNNQMKKSSNKMIFQSDHVHLQSIFSKCSIPPDKQNDIISLIDDLSDNDEILAIYLYGSYARNEPKPYSDIDVAVITRMANPPVVLKEIIGSYSSKKLDVQVFSDLPLSARMQVLSQGKVLYVRDEDSLWPVIKSVSMSYMDLEPMRYRWRKRILGV